MRQILLFAHLEKAYVKEDEIFSNYRKVGIMGETGQADGIHLHFGYLKCPDNQLVDASMFTSRNQTFCHSPNEFVINYGKVCEGYVTLNWQETYGSVYTSSNPHPGIDYSWTNGKDVFVPNKLKYKVLYNDYNSVYGNHLIIEVLGPVSPPPTPTGKYDKVYAENGKATFKKDSNIYRTPNTGDLVSPKTTYYVGESVIYDEVIYNDGFIWVGYDRNSGGRGYIATGKYDKTTLKRIETWCSFV